MLGVNPRFADPGGVAMSAADPAPKVIDWQVTNASEGLTVDVMNYTVIAVNVTSQQIFPLY